MKKNIYYRNSELKQRGWTDGLIKKFLPKPDETKTNPVIKSAAPMKLYKIKRVKGASISAISLDYQRFTRFTPNFTPQNVKLGVFFLLARRLHTSSFLYHLLWLYGIILGT